MKRIVSVLLVCFMLLSALAGCSGDGAAAPVAVDPVPEDFCGLVLKAPADATVFLYTEFADGEVVPVGTSYEADGFKYDCYSGIVGNYRCKVSGSGYYTVTKNIVMTQEKCETKTVMDVTPGMRYGEGWEPAALGLYTDELLADGFNSDLSQWPEYADVLTSPYFTDEHKTHQITTQAEMEAYIQSLDDAEDEMYLYSAGTSTLYRHDIPMVIFTQADLSGAKTLEEAAQCMGQDKPTVLYRCQMHGNEPAGGEAALAMIKWLDGELGQQLLDKINICVIPRQNPDGAQDYKRTMLGDIDPNRDSLRLKTQEIVSYMQICQLLEPELIIDGHEYNAQETKKTLSGGDILVGLGYTNDNSETFCQLNYKFAEGIFAAMGEQGLSYRYYSNHVNSINPSLSRAYASMQGTLFVLLESRGIGCGLAMYERRIVSHVISAETLLRYVAENAENVQQVVDAERQMIIDAGSRYDSNNLIALDVGLGEDINLSHDGVKYDQITGSVKEIVEIPKVYQVIERQRVAPTAYVIPAENGASVCKLMDQHGIEYSFIPAGSTVQLQQYDTAEQDLLTEEMAVTFPEGAYVFCKNQVRGLILSMLMEPDVDQVAEHSGTLVQQGLISATNGKYPIYRYVRDLNAEGFIDYR